MNLKRFFALGAAALMLCALLTGCGRSGQAEPAAGQEEQTLSGVINRMDDFLVLLTDAGEYQVMDLGEGVSLDGFAEGDSVTVTYTGGLGDEETLPVVSSIEPAE